MPFNDEGVHIVITGDASQALNELGKVNKSLNSLLAFQVG